MPLTPTILTDVRLFTGGCDLTSANNKLEFVAEVEAKDVTVYRSSGSGQHWTSVIGGIAKGTVQASGFWSAGTSDQVDDNLWPGMGGVGAWSWCPDTADLGAVGWVTQALQANYKILDAVGDVAPWEANASTTGAITRGVVLHPPGTARTTTGDGTGVEHVAVAAGQNLYANLHVLSVSGTSTPTITVVIESDASDTWSGGETTRISFDAATAIGGQSKSVAGAITDTWYRATWTITGTDPSFLFLVTLGVST
ncbi:hypothetical protein QTQ03_25295 [Micromonospora sp. WMMA1363]|uniref:hypothetical protein n=1 Tax=Micromonospora sp. WMMA1363 TaxID=3053985 RepID=UPI00259CB930|nr:hypothetical protein [Micromonospora sp. WMMA1363]MDM4722751.1 hypothetical protein [Micromonospora sp. WMMA1363]